MQSSSSRASSAGQSSPPVQRKIAPGPPGLPWLGQLPAFLRTKFFPKQMLKWAEEYNGVYRMEMVGKKYLVVADPELIAPVMGRGGPGLPKSEGYGMWDPVISPHPGVQGIVTVSENNETWRTVRRSYGPAMGLGTLGRYYPTIVRCASVLGDFLEETAWAADGAAPPTTPRSHEVNRLLKSLALDLLGLCAFGVDFGCLGDPEHAALGHTLERAMHEAGERGRNPGRRLLPWLYAREAREGQAAMEAFHAAVEAVWRDIKSRGPPAEYDTSMAAQFMRLADPERGSEALSDAQICAEIATIIVAGYETTANTLTWMMFALHANPEAAARLEDELRQAGLCPRDDDPGEDGPREDPSLEAFLALRNGHETISSLPYLDAFVRESLRMFSVAPNGAVKRVPAGGTPARIGPYDVDPGTTVWVPFWSVHLSERNWERPLEFEPERWMSQNPRTGLASAGTTAGAATSRCPVAAAVGAFQAAVGHDGGGGGGGLGAHLEATATASVAASGGGGSSSSSGGGGGVSRATRFVPFSDGTRNCVGQHLGMLQIKVVLSYLVSRFRVRLDEGRMGGVAGALERQRVNLTLEVEGGMWLFLEPRRQRGGRQQQQQQQQGRQ